MVADAAAIDFIIIPFRIRGGERRKMYKTLIRIRRIDDTIHRLLFFFFFILFAGYCGCGAVRVTKQGNNGINEF